jgi:ABC-type transport system substrate-binding protein
MPSFNKIFSFRHKKNVNDLGQRDRFDVNKKLVYSLSKSRIPNFGQLKYLGKFLSKNELLVMRVSAVMLVASLSFVSIKFYLGHREMVPVKGGEYVEAMVGSPRYINPLYASINDVDNDIAHLVYSSLFRHGKDGLLANDLVTSYEVSPEGKAYTLHIRPDAMWHNGHALRVDDVIFTFDAIKNAAYKSTLRQAFSGVEIERVDDNSVRFNLQQPYAPFLNLLTFGILPQDMWYQIPPDTASLADLNLKPIGTGPYKFKSLIRIKTV